MGQKLVEFLVDRKIYSCQKCGLHLTSISQLLSKGKHICLTKCSSQPKPPTNCSVNISIHEKHRKSLLTGLHTIADISCVGCDEIVGWHYFEADEPEQRYKIGKSVLEKSKLKSCLDELPAEFLILEIVIPKI